MADHDTSSLLLSPAIASSSTDELHGPSLDSMFERCVRDLGLAAQLLQALVVCLAWFFDAQQTFIAVFTDANPKWHCTTGSVEASNSNSSCDICLSPKDSWAWDSPAGSHSSIVSEWGLYCAPSFFSGLPSSSFFLGCIVGGFALATLADSSLGRKNTLLLSCLIMSSSSFLTAFSSNIWIYSTFRFLSGFGRANVGTCALVLSTELVGKRWRGQVGVTGFFAFTFGFLSLPLLAYALEGCSWRSLYIWTSVPVLLYCLLLQFSVRESPRWLLVQGHKEEAAVESFMSAMKMLFEKRWCIQRMVAVMSIGLGTGMSYYGMPLGLGNLGTNLYVSAALNALSELPAALFTLLLIGRLNRRGALVGFAMVSGICSVLSVMKLKVKLSLELVSFFCACTVVNVLLMFTIELFPTCVRNSAMSLVRQALVIGGVVGSFLAVAGRNMEFLSYGVFGIVIAACGLFAACLPETNGRSICDTMDEEERRHHQSPPQC